MAKFKYKRLHLPTGKEWIDEQWFNSELEFFHKMNWWNMSRDWKYWRVFE